MSYKDLLVVLDSDPASRRRIDLAAALAERFAAHLVGLYPLPVPEVPHHLSYYDPAVLNPFFLDLRQQAQAASDRGRIRPDAVINELTSLPRHYTPAEMKASAERDRKVRVEGNINLLAALRDAGVHRYMLQSSGFWYAPGTGLAD